MALSVIKQTIKFLHRRLSRYISIDALIWSNSVDVASFIDSVRDWTPLAAHKRVSACLDCAQDLLQQTMLRLEDECRVLLKGGSGSSRHLDYSDEDDGVSRSDGGDGKLSIDEVQQMQWTQLEEEIEKWIKAIHVTLRVLLPSERHLYNCVFSGCLSATDFSFLEVCRGSTVEILNFADAVAISSRSPERLFKVLDVYEAVRDLMPEFELIFSVPDGGLHPITRYVMNYLRASCRLRQTLEQVFEESVVDVDHGKVDEESASVLSVQLTWIMELLESNLEAKSKVYKDAALSSVFMMNNGRYIVQKANDNEL
ncbi:exocyst subunit exo70 family protein B1 [Perilla frutescens var. frutescens]|nr:exocyst subunit exo70 family protein B1 [Perilla frutescens var. frutescens]